MGWQYRRVGAVEPVLVENVRWLAGYRRPRFAQASVVEALVRVFADRRPLLDGAEARGVRSSCFRCCSICCGAAFCAHG